MSIFTFKKLYNAYLKCRKNKKNTVNALKFEMKREKYLYELTQDLKSHEYEISRHICFVVTDPKPREIFAAHFRDRVVHHLLYNEIEGLFEKDFLDSSYANRKFKGTHKAVEKLKWYTRRGGIDGRRLYALQLDVKNFFRRINKQVLWRLIKNGVENTSREEWWKKEVKWLAKKIIFHDPASHYHFKGRKETKKLVPREKSLLSGDKSCGLPIGNVTSQFFANVYLNELDHFIEEELGFDRYLRYVDDFVILHEDRARLLVAVDKIEQFLQDNLKLRLCTDKTKLQPTSAGVDFLGYYVKPTHTLVRRKIVKRFKKKLYQCRDEDGAIPADKEPMVQSYLGHLSHADSFNLQKELLG